MTTNIKIPTIIGLVVLLVGIVSGVLLIDSNKIFSLGAKPETSPKNIRVSNIQSTSATVSWVTGKKSQSILLWGETDSSQYKSEIVNHGEQAYIHSVNLSDLSPSMSYNYKIVSGGYEFDNEGIPWQFSTGPNLDKPIALVISGKVLASSGAAERNVILYASVGGGSPLSTKTEEDGTWLIPISYARSQDLENYVSINTSSTLIEIAVEGGPQGIASASIYPEAANPVPTMMLGQTHDFKDLPPQKEEGLRQTQVNIP